MMQSENTAIIDNDNSNLEDISEELSGSTLAALQEFLAEKAEREDRLQMIASGNAHDVDFDEDWQLSQFWYDEETANKLVEEALRVVGEKGTIACVSCPTVYKALKKRKPDDVNVFVLEYDTRFSVYGQDFVFYDYKSPLEIPMHLREQCDLVIVDPPFLSVECLTKTSLTVKLLAKEKIILCTGDIMGELGCRLLHLVKQDFQPRHKNNLANDFACFANYDFMII
nr:EOG090X0ABW [Artemia franciscana]